MSTFWLQFIGHYLALCRNGSVQMQKCDIFIFVITWLFHFTHGRTFYHKIYNLLRNNVYFCEMQVCVKVQRRNRICSSTFVYRVRHFNNETYSWKHRVLRHFYDDRFAALCENKFKLSFGTTAHFANCLNVYNGRVHLVEFFIQFS